MSVILLSTDSATKNEVHWNGIEALQREVCTNIKTYKNNKLP